MNIIIITHAHLLLLLLLLFTIIIIIIFTQLWITNSGATNLLWVLQKVLTAIHVRMVLDAFQHLFFTEVTLIKLKHIDMYD